MDIQKAVNMYNNEGKKLDEIGKELNCSKSTVAKNIKNSGYLLDKDSKKYIKKNFISDKQETIFPENHTDGKPENNVSRETIKPEKNKDVETVKCTFNIPKDVFKALKVKVAVESDDNKLTMSDVIEMALRKAIEKKYYIK